MVTEHDHYALLHDSAILLTDLLVLLDHPAMELEQSMRDHLHADAHAVYAQLPGTMQAPLRRLMERLPETTEDSEYITDRNLDHHGRPMHCTCVGADCTCGLCPF